MCLACLDLGEDGLVMGFSPLEQYRNLVPLINIKLSNDLKLDLYVEFDSGTSDVDLPKSMIASIGGDSMFMI